MAADVRQALVTKCSGKDRIRFERRHSIGTFAQRRAARPADDASTSFERMLRTDEQQHNRMTLSDALAKQLWLESKNRSFPAVAVSSRTKLCLVSICSLLNATQPQPPLVDVLALVDEDTPSSILRGYAKLGVRIIDLSDAPFPSYFNNRSTCDPEVDSNFTRFRRRTPLPPNATVGDAVRRGYPHFSAVPDSWYKLFLWNLTEYDKVFYFDPDTLTQHNATHAYLERYKPFTAQLHPHQGHPHTLQGGMMVLKPSTSDFAALHGLWLAGDYPYRDTMRRGDVSHGDDDQEFFNHAIIRRRVLSTPLHRLAPCDNDKRGHGPAGSFSHCDPDKAPMFHKWPLWESSRIDALWVAAQEGRCLANSALLNWQPGASTAQVQTTGLWARDSEGALRIAPDFHGNLTAASAVQFVNFREVGGMA